MPIRARWLGLVFALSWILSGSSFARAEEPVAAAVTLNAADMKFATPPGMPTCTTASVVSGDPATGPSILLAKSAAGCSIPWHWHTPNENLMIVSGTGSAQMKDGKAVALHAGAFAQMPSKHVHQFGCAKACMLYVFSDAAFDMHYVDAEGKDVSPDEALKKVHEVPAKAPN